MAGEFRDIMAWIVSTLMADTTLTSTYGVTGVFMTEAPEEQQYPYIVVQRQTGNHRYTLGTHVRSSDWLLIKAVDMPSQDVNDGGDLCRRITTRVSELIEHQFPTIPGGYIYIIRRQSDVDYVTAEPGSRLYHQVGSVYTVQYF